ncbi:MAG: F0F1 ATP synthase subunit alpha [Mycoplasma sp.]|nr:F0F1 ATP synthase subunit alpha [Mycoplasma sp.]
MSIKITQIKDYIIEVSGENKLMINEIIKFKNGTRGIVMKATTNKAYISMLDISVNNPLNMGDEIEPTKKEFSIEFTENILGNIINVEGDLLTTYENAELTSVKTTTRPVFRLARPIYSRDFIDAPLQTGLSSVDWAIPIGLGQRELILGDRQTGKTSIALNAILAQKETGVKTVYVAIGQKKTTILDIYEKLRKFGMLDKVVVVSASADQTATKKYLAPYVGVTIAEYFQEKYGDDVLVIYDDLSKHADAYRELSLLMKSAPAREAYPGDIFYLHSKLLERAGRFNEDFGNGSITALPIVQTEAGDITSYIPTNVISITDGQIFTSKKLFNSGHRPAIDIPYSVSRVGSTAQTKSLSSVSGGLKLTVSQYEEAMKMVRLSGEVSEENADIIESGKVLMALLTQPEADVLDYNTGTLLLFLFKKKYLNFFEKKDEVIYIKNILNKYLLEDFIGKKIREIIIERKIEEENFILILREIILPMIKHYLLKTYSYLRKNEKFYELYKDIRDDGRVLNAITRKEI